MYLKQNTTQKEDQVTVEIAVHPEQQRNQNVCTALV